MSAEYKNREIGHVTIVDCIGRITLGEGAEGLKYHIRQLVSSQRKEIIINLADTSYIDSSGIGELTSGFMNVANVGGSVKLLSLSKRVKALLQITKLYSVFEVFDDEAAAIRSFR